MFFSFYVRLIMTISELEVHMTKRTEFLRLKKRPWIETLILPLKLKGRLRRLPWFADTFYALNQEPGGPETCTIRHFKAFFMPYNQFAYSKGLWPFVCPCSRYTWLQIIKIVQICGSVLHYKSGTRWSRDMYNTPF